MRTLTTSLALSLALLSSCTKTQVGPSVDVQRLADVYTQLLVLNERYNLSKDSLSQQQYAAACERILHTNGMTKDDYVSQFETVTASPGLYRQLCDLALMNLQRMRQKPDSSAVQGRS